MKRRITLYCVREPIGDCAPNAAQEAVQEMETENFSTDFSADAPFPRKIVVYDISGRMV